MQITAKLKTTTKIKERQTICRHNRHSDLSFQISCTDAVLAINIPAVTSCAEKAQNYKGASYCNMS